MRITCARIAITVCYQEDVRVLSVMLLSAVACGAEQLPFEPAGPTSAPAPSLTGPYPVGVRTILLEDDTRMTPGGSGPRLLKTEVWYPTVEAVRGQGGARYGLSDVLSPAAIAATKLASAVDIPTTAVRDAEPRVGDGPFPVVFFSHGSNAVRIQSTYLTLDLASHGYVVIAPDHEGNTLSDLLVEGEFDNSQTLAYFILRPDDIRFVMEHFRFLPDGDPLEGMMDFAKVGVAGHSFGAFTAMRVAALADKTHPVHMAIAQAPPSHGLTWVGIEKPLAELTIPVMIQAGAVDATIPIEDARSFWPNATQPKMELILDTAGHFTFSDLCRLDQAIVQAVADIGVGDAFGDGCAPANISPEAAYALLRHFTIGGFNAFLRDSPPTLDLLDEATAKALGGADSFTFRREL